MLSKLKEWIFGSKEEKETGKAIHETRKLSTQGKSYYINIPKKWFDLHDIEPEEIEELTLLANSDVLIVNPNRENEVKEKLEEKTWEVYKEEKSRT